MKHTNGPHDAPSERAHHPNGRNNAPSNRDPLLPPSESAPSERTPLLPPSESAPSQRKLFQTGPSGALSERTGAIWDTDRAISFRDCTTCCEAAPSRAAIAPNDTKGCVSPNGARHAMGRRDAPSEAKRHDAGRRGVSAANGRGSPVLTPRQTGGSLVLTPQPSLAATKHPGRNPRPQRNKRHAANNRRFPLR